MTVWLSLQNTMVEMGPLTFAAGSHRTAEGRDMVISDDSDAALERAINEHGFAVDESAYHLGDASYHAGWTVHRAPANSTDTPRRVMTVIYMDADIRVAEPRNEWQVADWKEALNSVPPGQIAEGPLNPVLWRAG